MPAHHNLYIDAPTFEEADEVTNKNGPYIPEMAGFTPLQLSLVGAKPNY